MKAKYLKVLEAVVVAAVSASVAMVMIYFNGDCKPCGLDSTENPIQVGKFDQPKKKN